MDTRQRLARSGLAGAALEGRAPADHYASTQAMQGRAPAASLHAAPDDGAEQSTQLLFGERFEVLEVRHGWALGQAVRDGYVGYVRAEQLTVLESAPTHWISALRTYAFADADLKSPIAALLSMNSLCRVEAQDGRFMKAAGAGWVFAGHLSPIGAVRGDLVQTALEFLGAPYQWGGRESLGLDCSGLVQNALYACGRSCPRDSDQQFAGLGEPVDAGALRRGDLVFWSGHVAVMIDSESMVHASGHHMQTVVERLAPAVDRIRAAGAGGPLGFRRLRLD